jgi:uncharacterized protein (TIGR02453 family)
MDFNGFPADAVTFLSELSDNNDRAWFLEQKQRYKESVEAPAEAFREAMLPLLSQLAGEPMAGKLFRIHRDVRFSRDKSPYNTHVRLMFHCADADSGCGDRPVFCFSLETDRIITGAGTGTMEFSAQKLDRYRAAVATPKSGAALAKLLSAYTPAQGYRIDPPALKRPPAGYTAAPEHEALLRHKALMVWHEAPLTKDLHRAAFATQVMRRYDKMKPVFDWIAAL